MRAFVQLLDTDPSVDRLGAHSSDDKNSARNRRICARARRWLS